MAYRRKRLLAGAVCALVGASSYPSNAKMLTLTLKHARSRPAKELARSAFARFSEQIVEMRRSDLTGGVKGHRPEPLRLTFGTRSRSAGDSGVCAADVINVQLDHLRRHGRVVGDQMEPTTMQIETRFKIVGSIDIAWSKEIERENEIVCRQQHNSWDFFHSPNGNTAVDAARVVQYVNRDLMGKDKSRAALFDVSRIKAVEERTCVPNEPDPIHNRCIWIMLKNSDGEFPNNGEVLTATIHLNYPSGGRGWAVEVHNYNWSPAFVP